MTFDLSCRVKLEKNHKIHSFDFLSPKVDLLPFFVEAGIIWLYIKSQNANFWVKLGQKLTFDSAVEVNFTYLKKIPFSAYN